MRQEPTRRALPRRDRGLVWCPMQVVMHTMQVVMQHRRVWETVQVHSAAQRRSGSTGECDG